MKKFLLVVTLSLIAVSLFAQRTRGRISRFINDSTAVITTSSGMNIQFCDPRLKYKSVYLEDILVFVKKDTLPVDVHLVLSFPETIEGLNGNPLLLPAETEVIYVDDSRTIFLFPFNWRFSTLDTNKWNRKVCESILIECFPDSAGKGCKLWQRKSKVPHQAIRKFYSTPKGFSSEAVNDHIFELKDGISMDFDGGIQFMFNEKISGFKKGKELTSEFRKSKETWKDLISPPPVIYNITEVKASLDFFRNKLFPVTPEFIKANTVAPCKSYKYVSVYFFGYGVMMAMKTDYELMPYMQVIANGKEASCACAKSVGTSKKSYHDFIMYCVPDNICEESKLCHSPKFGSTIPVCK